MIRTMIAASASAVVLLGVAAPAAGYSASRRTELTLSYMADAGYASAVKLWCDPAGGAHPYPAKACRTLQRVDGRPSRLRPAHTMCILIYAPITAEVKGVWKGRRVHWSTTYGNACEMRRATGVLFRF